MTNNHIIQQLNDSLQQWKSTFVFYAPDQVALSFSSSQGNQLCFNQFPLCYVSDLQLEDVVLDIDRISFQFSHSRSLVIHIGWPEEQLPYAKSVFFGYFFLPAHHNQLPTGD